MYLFSATWESIIKTGYASPNIDDNTLATIANIRDKYMRNSERLNK